MMAMNRISALLLLLFVPAVCSALTFTNDKYGYSIDIDDSLEMTRNDDTTYFRSKDNDNVVIIKNRSDLDEASAREYLQQAGFESVYNLKGGMNGWTQAGLPVVTGKKTKSKKR